MKTGTALSVTCLSVFLMIASLNAFETSPNLNPSVQVAVEDFLVSDSGAVGGKYTPRIAVDGAVGFVITWLDGRYGSNIYAQRFNNSGNKIGTNFKVCDGKMSVYNPSIAYDKSGNFVIAWTDNRPYYDYAIYAQRYNNSGNPLGKNFKVSDTIFSGFSSVGFDQNGNFLIAWYNKIGYTYLISAQKYNNTGTPLGTNIFIDSISANFSMAMFNFSFAFDKSTNFVTLWDEYADVSSNPPQGDVFALNVSNMGSPIGAPSKLCNDTLNRWQLMPSAAFDTSGGFVAAWIDEREINYAVYAQRYDKNYAKVGTNFRVSDDVGGFKKYYPKVAVEESGNFIIAWIDDRTGNTNPSIYAQRYDKNGSAIGTNFKINSIPDTVYDKQCDIKLQNSKIYTTWLTYSKKNNDIWANILDWTNPIQISDINNPSYPNSLRCGLAQNYPNPFTTATTIKYSLPKDDQVSLSVYTLTGRNIKQLVAGKKGAGNYSAVWDGRNEAGQAVPAGVYVYKLVSGKYQETRRMVVKR